MLYDILLLIIYNVQQPILSTSSLLSEYLENLYKELGIQLEQGCHSNREINTLNRYLSLQNLWPIEKLVTEFR
jgi:hypothetical protein